jgi:DNA replication protein DnaC
MNEDLKQLLQNLKLKTIAARFDEMLAAAEQNGTPIPTFMAQLLRAEWHTRQEQALQARIDRANFREEWTLESFPFKAQKGVKERQIRTLAELEFIPKAENIIWIGETGVGKTGLMISLARKAVQNGYRALFITAQDLLDELYASLADRSSRRLLKTLANVDVLCIDELGYANIKTEQTNIFFKLIEERHHRKPTLIMYRSSWNMTSNCSRIRSEEDCHGKPRASSIYRRAEGPDRASALGRWGAGK